MFLGVTRTVNVNDVVWRRLFWVLLVEKNIYLKHIEKQQHVECISYIYIELVTVHLRMHFRKPGPNIKRTKRLWQTNMSNKFYHPAPLWNQSQNASIYFSTHPNLPCRPKKNRAPVVSPLNSLKFLSFPSCCKAMRSMLVCPHKRLRKWLLGAPKHSSASQSSKPLLTSWRSGWHF